MMLIGRPGLDKTPPLGFIYKPIGEHDGRMYEPMKRRHKCDKMQKYIEQTKEILSLIVVLEYAKRECFRTEETGT